MKKLFYLANLLTLCFIFNTEAARAQAPVITSQPVNDTVCVGDTAHFIVAASDTLAMFIWESFDGTTWDTVFNGGAYSGATNDTLMVVGSMALNGMWYRAVAYNASGDTTSDSAMLVVNPSANAGVIVGPSSVCYTGMIMLTDSVSGGVWSSSNGNATVSSTGMVMGVRRGIDTIKYKVTTSCGMDSVTHVVRIDSTLPHDTIYGPTAVCMGSSITLTAGMSGGTWNVSNGNATISSAGSVTGIMYGMDTVTYISMNACNMDTAYRVITIDSPIRAATVSGPGRVCVGSWVSFTTTGTGGMWLSSNSGIASTDSMGNVTGRSAGTAIISYTHSNSCGTVAAMDNIVVERNASMITGSDSVGVGRNIILADSAIGGTWSTTDTLVARIDSTGRLTGISVGFATVTYMVTNICGTSWVSKLIAVGDAPMIDAIAGPDTVCGNSNNTYSNTFTGGTWLAINGAGSIDASGTFHANDTGSVKDTIYYTYTNGFGTTTVRKIIYIRFSPPRIVITPITAVLVVGNPYTLVATPGGGTWTSSNPSRIALTTATNFTPLLAGPVFLVYSYSNVCGSSKDSLL
ncbi:MAG: hypothetical protein H7257_03875, partial [Taibaiella sp.]|nr:hypothetical protein [Taibaiella sp.]